MPAPKWWHAGDFDAAMLGGLGCAGDALGCAGDVLGELRQAFSRMSAHAARAARTAHAAGEGHPGYGGSGARWDWGFLGPKGPGRWGGSGGPWGGWWPGPPGAPGSSRGAKAGRGDVRSSILALLREGPCTGYQIMSEIEERSGGAWRPSPGAVYPALAQLADEGLIVGEESGGRRTFSLTDAGREYVEQNPDLARGAWESRAQQEAWQLPGLFAVAARLGGTVVQIAHAGTPEQVRAAERVLEQTRRDLYRILADDLDAGEEESQGDEHGDE